MADDARDDAKAGVSDPASSIQLKIRIKPALRAQLQAAAAEHGVSLNQEIVYRLLRSFVEDTVIERVGGNYEKLQRRVDEMEEEMDKTSRRLLAIVEQSGRRG